MYFIRSELKNAAKEQLRGKWSGAVLVTFIYAVITAVVSTVVYRLQVSDAYFHMPFAGLLSMLVTAPLMIGAIIYFLALTGSNEQPETTLMFRGFSNYGKSLGIYLWNALWVFLWSLLFIIPGIIKSIAYSQSFFIIADNPKISVTDALRISMKMTEGQKVDIFVMYLSFIGWAILAALTFGIGYLWLGPYMTATYCNMYRKLKEMSLQSGACRHSDFEGGIQ